MAQSRSKSKPQSRYPEPELKEEWESAEFWLIQYNRKVFKTLSDIHGNTETTRRDVADIKENMATKATVVSIYDQIEALTKMVREGFDTLGVNISNGDHRVGGRAIRPVK